MFDYENDEFGRACLRLASRSRGNIGFGALLVKNGRILGRGWNHRPRKEERGIISHVDYAIHAEQAAFVDARLRGLSETELAGSAIYVVGRVLQGKERGKLTVRDRKIFICRKCPRSVFVPFDIPVFVPHRSGWCRLSPQRALETADEICGSGYWKTFAAAAAFKVLREDLTSLGLLGAPRKHYAFNAWNVPDEPVSRHARKGGGLWVAPAVSDARAMQRYVFKKYGMRTRIFRCRIGRVLHQTSCRIKTDRVFFSPKDEVRD